MLSYNARRAFEEFNSAQDLLPVRWMLAHSDPFLVRELGRFAENRIRYSDFSNVVQQRAELKRLHLRTTQAVFATKPQAIGDNALGMPMRFGVAGFQCCRQCVQG